MTQTHEELIGTFVGEKFRREDWIIGKVKGDDGKIVSINGNSDPGELAYGSAYKFFGRHVEHPKFGAQFEFNSFCDHVPTSRDGVIRYLSSLCDGIGSVIAARIYDHYEGDATWMLRESPESVATECGFPVSVANAAAETLRDNLKWESVKIELMGLFAGRGFPRDTIKRAIQRWKGAAAERVKRDFALLTAGFPGIGFLRADKFYLDQGYNPSRIKRQTLCAWNEIESDTEGHTWFPEEESYKAIRKTVPGTVQPKKAIEIGIRAKWISRFQDQNGRYWITTISRATAEDRIAAKLAELQETEATWPYDVSGISEHQAEQLRNATLGPVGILAGSPGTGKTYTLAALIRQIQHDSPTRIYAAAPTGKAAVRVTENLQKNGVDIPATTQHRLLGINPTTGGFNYNAKRPLPSGVLILDEGSMDDVELFAATLDACPRGMRVLVVGDPYQLAPVGHGAPLRDLIAAQVPCGELTEIRRNAGRIVRTCHELKDGKPFHASPALDLDVGENLILIDAKHASTQVEVLIAELTKLRDAGEVDIVRDVQILCTVNEKSDIGRVKLNKRLQEFFNPGESIENCPFRIGDKVICLKNTWMKREGKAEEIGVEQDDFDQEPGREKEVYVSNGDVGFIESMTATEAIVEFSNPKRLVRTYLRGKSCVIDLAYAITVHKSQGSEWPIVFVMADSSAGANWVACRELWYTAISRASRYCVVIGEKKTVDAQCRKVSLSKRKTFLREKAEEAMERLLVEVEGF